MKRAVCPGSFDPITYGHLDIIERAAQQFDHVVVAVLENRTKSSLFTVTERIGMITEVTKKFPNVSVDSWSGLLVEYCKSNSIQAIVKGLRAVTDLITNCRWLRSIFRVQVLKQCSWPLRQLILSYLHLLLKSWPITTVISQQWFHHQLMKHLKHE